MSISRWWQIRFAGDEKMASVEESIKEWLLPQHLRYLHLELTC
ncbi:MAG TPA: hypothetical protein VJO33_05380 [Gemmatimonadaceae bacterium]|nr:hypothetical protein [Gemmatimonadaceae bacterium]